MYVDFDEMPDTARVWVFQSTTHIEMEELEMVSARLLGFLEGWQAHGKDLKASFQIFYERFIIVALDEASYQATGCSIDKLTHIILSMERDFKLSLLDRMQIAYREDGLIHTMPLAAFRASLEEDELDSETLVFNNLIETKGELKDKWEVAIKDSWHKQLLPVA